MTAPESPLDTYVPPPPSEELAIWRYMDFTKFVALLENRALFFVRVSRLEDPFEGSFPSQQTPLHRVLGFLPGPLPPNTKISLGPRLEQTWMAMRHWAMVSCWHASDHESAAMWKLYAASDLAIAVRSTVGRLRRALGTPPSPKEGFHGLDRFHIGMVEYIDFETGHIPAGSFASQFYRKRQSFEHERELRAMILEFPIRNTSNFDYERAPDDDGRLIPVDLATLVDAVFVAPQAPSWYAELAKLVAARYGLQVVPQHSRLDAAPLY